jgi:uncharacterized protein
MNKIAHSKFAAILPWNHACRQPGTASSPQKYKHPPHPERQAKAIRPTATRAQPQTSRNQTEIMNTLQVSPESFAAERNEELAGPVSTIAPTKLSDRISSIDVLRGFALLGILVLNIEDFAGVEVFHDIPVGGSIDNFTGPHAHLNLILLLVKWMFFEGKMRGIFSMLFGAGIILMTSRAERRGRRDVADIYTRRNLLLMFFGVLHTCFIWDGDILFDFGFKALLFLYPLRKLKPKTLLWAGTLLSLTAASIGFAIYMGAVRDLPLSRQAASIEAQQRSGRPATPQQLDVLHQWQERIDSQKITPAKTKAAVAEGTLPYLASVRNRVQEGFQSGFYVIHINVMVDMISAIMIGMGLMKIGFFSAELSFATYWWTVLIGFGISLPLTAAGVLKAYVSHFYFLDVEKWMFFPYYIGRESGSLAISALVILIVKSGLLKTPQRLLAAVGRTAFTNYILTSIICQTIFVWGPWKLYDKLEYYQQMYVVFGVWAFNLIASSLWLRSFAYGPLEWLWRSLTYGARQPMRLNSQS